MSKLKNYTAPERAAQRIKETGSGVLEYSPGNMTMYTIMYVVHEGVLWLGISGHGAYQFHSMYNHPNYVAEKLNVHVGDAHALAPMINAAVFV